MPRRRRAVRRKLPRLSSQAHVPDAPGWREEIHRLVPGLGETATVRIGPAHAVVGRSLKDVNLRALTGATVIAIERRQQPAIVYPNADEVLQAGDLLVLTGTQEAVKHATDLVVTDAQG
jgi:CPA2 family monovalent cation:H+ antiporter-2